MATWVGPFKIWRTSLDSPTPTPPLPCYTQRSRGYCNSRSRSVFRSTVFVCSNWPSIVRFPRRWLPLHSLRLLSSRSRAAA